MQNFHRKYLDRLHSLKSVSIRSFFCPVFSCIRIKYRYFLYVFSPNTGKYEPEKTPYLETFHAVQIFCKFLLIFILLEQQIILRTRNIFYKKILLVVHPSMYVTFSIRPSVSQSVLFSVMWSREPYIFLINTFITRLTDWMFSANWTKIHKSN